MSPTLSDDERLDWLRLARTDGIGPVTFHRLIRAYGSARVALEAAPDIARRAGRSSALTPYSADDAAMELANLGKLGGRLIASCEADFPTLLGQIHPAPPIISVIGDLALFAKPAVAMVGARNASAAGLRLAREIAAELSEGGYLIVSGLARGIDGAAHAAALRGGTAAVLAGGLNHIYPQEHAALYTEIKQSGLIISENRLGATAMARDFPRRNRLVSGLSLGVVVIEAALQSGSLITARTALEQNREVMAVPGSPIDARARGSNDLIRQGATLVESANDIIKVLQNQYLDPRMAAVAREQYTISLERSEPSISPVGPDLLQRIRGLLSPTPIAIDEVARLADASVADTSAAILELELAGYAASSPGGRVALVADA